MERGHDAEEGLLMSNLLLRILSALVLIPIAVGIVWLGGWAFAGLLLLAGAVMLHEWGSVSTARLSLGVLGVQVLGLIVLIAFMVLHLPVWALVAAIITIILVFVVAAQSGQSLRWSFFGTIYVYIPIAALVWLRDYADMGFAWTIWTLVIVWATDIGGYIFGKSLGGPRLAPRVSPKKTWAGLIGGAIFASAAAVALGWYFELPLSITLLAIGGGVLAVWAQIGDLVESGFKRRFGVKDSGSLIPGHGGVLDRVDGLVFVAPLVAAGVAFAIVIL